MLVLLLFHNNRMYHGKLRLAEYSIACLICYIKIRFKFNSDFLPVKARQTSLWLGVISIVRGCDSSLSTSSLNKCYQIHELQRVQFQTPDNEIAYAVSCFLFIIQKVFGWFQNITMDYETHTDPYNYTCFRLLKFRGFFFSLQDLFSLIIAWISK